MIRTCPDASFVTYPDHTTPCDVASTCTLSMQVNVAQVGSSAAPCAIRLELGHAPHLQHQ
jgi:hypothetical protein